MPPGEASLGILSKFINLDKMPPGEAWSGKKFASAGYRTQYLQLFL